MKTPIALKTLFVIAMLAVASPAMSSTPIPSPIEDPAEQRAMQLKNRLEEIRAMDVDHLSKPEKKALRAEVKAIKKEIKEISGGVYLSVGAIILIVLLIILLA